MSTSVNLPRRSFLISNLAAATAALLPGACSKSGRDHSIHSFSGPKAGYDLGAQNMKKAFEAWQNSTETDFEKTRARDLIETDESNITGITDDDGKRACIDKALELGAGSENLGKFFRKELEANTWMARFIYPKTLIYFGPEKDRVVQATVDQGLLRKDFADSYFDSEQWYQLHTTTHTLKNLFAVFAEIKEQNGAVVSEDEIDLFQNLAEAPYIGCAVHFIINGYKDGALDLAQAGSLASALQETSLAEYRDGKCESNRLHALESRFLLNQCIPELVKSVEARASLEESQLSKIKDLLSDTQKRLEDSPHLGMSPITGHNVKNLIEVLYKALTGKDADFRVVPLGMKSECRSAR